MLVYAVLLYFMYDISQHFGGQKWGRDWGDTQDPTRWFFLLPKNKPENHILKF